MLYDDLATILSGLATAGVDLHFGGLRATPANQVSLRAHPGPGEDVTATGAAMEHPRFHVEVRDEQQHQAWVRARAIRARLLWYDGTVNGTRYENIESVGTLADLGQDEGGTWRVGGSYELAVVCS